MLAYCDHGCHCLLNERERKIQRSRRAKEKKVFQLILFLREWFAGDAGDESVCRGPHILASYSLCRTSRSIFESASERTCALMHLDVRGK